MSSNYSSSRPPRRNPRAREARNNSAYTSRPTRTVGSNSKTEPKVGFFGKVLALFGMGSDSKNKKPIQRKNTAPSSRSEHSTERNASSTERRSSRPVSRKPEITEVTSPRLYIGNLSFDATESDLFELFSGIGQVQNVELISYHDTHRSKGFGFIQMTSVDEAKRAVNDLHDKEYMGRKLVVSGARALPEHRAEARPEPRSETTCSTTPAETTPTETSSEESSCCHHTPDKEQIETSCCHHSSEEHHHDQKTESSEKSPEESSCCNHSHEGDHLHS
ncbi:MAG: hypothetical protein A3F67_09520 [Verrucomicrobia bacterium RIFCSPHIGHO2_12_FULL_41_10]|nr:MAG: hypothetical protein A3F67_09520 [Verrucomicrobia bacterium RIFCSPHIGHO2_12_FULL_41_10]HLB34720.1 RNA-binding protein [Chthoniobacterales bacterium]